MTSKTWVLPFPPNLHFFFFSETAYFKVVFLSENNEHRLKQTKYFYHRFIHPILITDKKILLIQSCDLYYPFKEREENEYIWPCNFYWFKSLHYLKMLFWSKGLWADSKVKIQQLSSSQVWLKLDQWFEVHNLKSLQADTSQKMFRKAQVS